MQDSAPSTPPFQPGFRLSLLDGCVLLAGAAASVWVTQVDSRLGWLIAFTVGHFFLFCNVVRMARTLELIWTAIYLALAVSCLLLGVPSLAQTLGAALLTSAVLVLVQTRSPAYHGVLWQRINPGLPAWWQQKHPTGSGTAAG